MDPIQLKRNQIVKKFNKLNFVDNKELNDLMYMAVETCDVPIVTITLMKEKTHVVKCKIGLKTGEMSYLVPFYNYLANNKVLVIPDTRDGGRSTGEPAATGYPGIRFYAGIALITSAGLHIGALSVVAREPRSFTARQQEMLAILSRQVIYTLELQLSLTTAKQQNLILKNQRKKTAASVHKIVGFFNSSPSCHVLLDKEYKILDFNKAMETFITDHRLKQIKNGVNVKTCVPAIYMDKFIKFFKLGLLGVRTDKEFLLHTGIDPSWWNVSFQPIFDKKNNVSDITFTATNVDVRKKNESQIVRQNQLLLEVTYIQSHEYRRPVASILGLMNIIKEDLYDPDKECLMMMETAVLELDSKLKKVVNRINDIPLKSKDI